MKVKIGNTYYDSDDQPIMIILDGNHTTDHHFTKLSNQKGQKYCEYPHGTSTEEIERFMELGN